MEIEKIEKLRVKEIQLRTELNALEVKYRILKGDQKKALRSDIENNQTDIKAIEQKIDIFDKKTDDKISKLNNDLNSSVVRQNKIINDLEVDLSNLIGLTSDSIKPRENAINQEKDNNIKIVDNNIKDLNDQITALEADKPKYQSNKGENKTFFEDRNYLIEERNIQVEKVRKISNSNQIYNLALTIKLNPFIRWVSGGEVPENFGAEIYPQKM